MEDNSGRAYQRNVFCMRMLVCRDVNGIQVWGLGAKKIGNKKEEREQVQWMI